jgi:hypothetical protein
MGIGRGEDETTGQETGEKVFLKSKALSHGLSGKRQRSPAHMPRGGLPVKKLVWRSGHGPSDLLIRIDS